MNRAHPMQNSGVAQTVKQLVLSSIVVAAFSAYTLVEHFTGRDGGAAASQTTPNTTRTNPSDSSSQPRKGPQTDTSGAGAPGGTPVPAFTPANAPAIPNASPTARPSATARAIPPTATPRPTNTPVPVQTGAKFKDGEFVGDPKNAFYGLVQVKAVIQGGQLNDVQFLTYPADRRTSQRINQIANPMLQDEAIHAQSYQVDIISGATLTSRAFIQSLQTALARAKP